jgi:MFS family permease
MSAAPGESSVVSKQVIPQLLSMPNFRSLILVSSVLALTTLSDNFLYLMMQIKFGFELSLFPLLYVGTALAYMILAIPIGRLSDRLGRRNVFIAGYGLLAIVYGLLLSSILPAGFLWLILLLQGLFYAATDGVLAALASAIVPEQWRTTGLAVMTTGTGIARLLASIAYGALWTFMGPYQALSLFLGGLFITMILVLTVMNRVEGKVDGAK